MPSLNQVDKELDEILRQYKNAFGEKLYTEENDELDLLMTVFGITPEVKRENRQYWGRELGMCWQRIVVKLFEHYGKDFKPALRFGADEPCDLVVGSLAIDTKYRIGSGDSGTLKKFRNYAALLREKGYTPVLLIVRPDNLAAAITACRAGGWDIYTADSTYSFIQEHTAFDIKGFLQDRALSYKVVRP